MRKTMKESKGVDRHYKCIKPLDGFIVGQVYPTDIFGWVDNGLGIVSFDLDKFELVEDEK